MKQRRMLFITMASETVSNAAVDGVIEPGQRRSAPP
jgi:hypothetical protein